MLARGFAPARIIDEVGREYAEHVPGAEREISYWTIRNIRDRRGTEIEEIREKLATDVSDIWIARRRFRLETLAQMFEFAAKQKPPELAEMRRILSQAREEAGEDPGSRAAMSLEQLVTLAEAERGRERTVFEVAQTQDSVTKSAGVAAIDIPSRLPSDPG